MDVVHEEKKSGKITELAPRSIGAEKLYQADDKVVLNFKSALQNLLLLFFFYIFSLIKSCLTKTGTRITMGDDC